MPLFLRDAPRYMAAATLCALAAPAFSLSLTISNGGTVNLGNRTYTSITISNGTAVNNTGTPITGALAFGGSADNWTGTLDLQANKMIVQPASSKAAALAKLQNQAAFGASHPAGIRSTALPAHMGIAVIDNAVTNFGTFGNQPVDGNSLLLSPELLGDANVDGKVDLTDLSVVLNHFGTSTPNWTSGNFDYGPSIDLTDLSDVLNNFGLTSSTPFVQGMGMAQAVAAPEPGFLGAVFPIAVLLFRRNRWV
ncbi:MAG: hypothetical protein ACTHN5_18935 [Phycisphaerae bacterium]